MTDRVHVYDSRNPDRLLGSLPRHIIERCHPSAQTIETMVIPHARPRLGMEDTFDFNTYRVSFTKSWREVEKNWRMYLVLLTDASLDLLMMLDEFRLPTENEEQAYYRRMAA